LVFIAFTFNLSGGGLIADFVTPLVEQATIFAGSGLNSVTGLETKIFGGTDIFFTEVSKLVFSGALLADGLTEDPDEINFVDVFSGEPGDLGDPDKVFDPEPVLEIVIGPDFFAAEGKVMVFYNKNI